MSNAPPPGNGWVPYRGGWRNSINGVSVGPDGRQTSPGPGYGRDPYKPQPTVKMAKGETGPPLPRVVKNPIPPLKLPGRVETTGAGGLPGGAVNVTALQNFLRGKGYNIKVDGVFGKETRAAVTAFGSGKVPPNVASQQAIGLALKGTTHPEGAVAPAKWNQAHATVVDRSLDPKGNIVKGTPDAPVDLRALSAIAAQTGTMIPQSLADMLANNAAGAQFDPQIHDAQAQLAHAPQQAAQNQADIGNWYGQVQGAQKTATSRDHAISGAGVDSMRQALASIISSIGGSANDGSASVGAAGANNIGTLEALGNVQDQYNQDLAPLLKLAQSGAATGQRAQDLNAQTTQQQHLADLQGQRGQTQAATKAQTLLQIIQQNNATGQQGFQNRLNVQAAGEAAQLQGLKVLQAYQKAQTPAKGTFAAANTTDLGRVAATIHGLIVDSSGNPLPGMTSAKATAIARSVGGTFFPQGGVSAGWAQGVVSPFFPNG